MDMSYGKMSADLRSQATLAASSGSSTLAVSYELDVRYGLSSEMLASHTLKVKAVLRSRREMHRFVEEHAILELVVFC